MGDFSGFLVDEVRVGMAFGIFGGRSERGACCLEFLEDEVRVERFLREFL